MKQYRHSFQVSAPLRKVIDFHSHPQSMGAITPPPIIARMQRAPAVLGEGDEMEFTLWVGPLPGLFAYRAWKTQKLLARQGQGS